MKELKSQDTDNSDKKWNNDGIMRFNELTKLVSEDREKHPRFELDMIHEERVRLSEKKGKKKRVENEPIVRAINDLGGSSDEEDSDGEGIGDETTVESEDNMAHDEDSEDEETNDCGQECSEIASV